jgi:hypothetical protein
MRQITRLFILLLAAIPAAAFSAPPVPDEVHFVAESAEDIIDLYNRGEWSQAQNIVDSINSVSPRVEAVMDSLGFPRSSADVFGYLRFQLDRLTRYARRPVEAALAANQLTAFTIDIQSHFAHVAPMAASWMDYYGREIVLLAPIDSSKILLPKRLNELERSWKSIEDDVKQHNGGAVAQKVNGTITRLKQADSIEERLKNGNKILDLVDEIEMVYR